ncbi:MAG: hypothetical protein PHC38_12565, partial [Weeksellaceae bacterium]|nr:hypothetical protein [Weeksellaceae bacterium]
AGHYFDHIGTTKPTETMPKVMKGRDPKIKLNIHNVSEVNSPDRDISQIYGPATSRNYQDTGKQISDKSEEKE